MKSRGSLRWHFSASRKDTKREVNPSVTGSTFACQGQPTPRPTEEQLCRSHRHPARPWAAATAARFPPGSCFSPPQRPNITCLLLQPHPLIAWRSSPARRDAQQLCAHARPGPRTPGPTSRRPCGPNEDPSETGTGRTSATIPPQVVDLRAQGGTCRVGGHEIRDRQVGGVRPACARCARGRRRGSLRSPRRKPPPVWTSSTRRAWPPRLRRAERQQQLPLRTDPDARGRAWSPVA